MEHIRNAFTVLYEQSNTVSFASSTTKNINLLLNFQ